MPLYQYKALSEKGSSFRSAIEADSLQDAKTKLLREKISVFQISELPTDDVRAKLSKSEIVNTTRELARLLHAGLPLFEALSALEEKYRRQKAHRMLLHLCDQVKSGSSFSKALQMHAENFDLLYIAMVANAEKTGRLEEALNEIAILFSAQERVRKELIATLLYPAILSLFCLVVLSSLLFYVIPSLKELFEGRDLHPFTQLVFAASQFACHFKYLIAIGAAFLLALGCAIPFSASLKRRGMALAARLPFFKTLLAKIAFIRFGRAAATLLEGGLPLIEALRGARRVMRHVELEAVVERAEKRIGAGESVSAPFQNHPLIPPLVPRILSIAEEGGKLPFMMKQLAEIYEDELEKTLRSFATIAQPLLLLILGAIIGFVLLSVLLPLTDVSSFATN